jgi:uncharacterized Ntn-hydrolase superfamily protein
MTFSIAAADPSTEEVGVATQSKFLAVGAVVPWARAGVGAVATQAFAEITFGPRGLDLLAEGLEPQAVLDRLLGADERRNERQLGVVDARGRSASYTGPGCFEHAASVTGPNFACQGNILASDRVVPAMAEAFDATAGQPLADRMLSALRAAQREGGDRRGQEAAAILIHKPGGSYGGTFDRYIDLRVDHDDEPIEELSHLLALHQLYFDHSRQGELITADPALEAEIAEILKVRGKLTSGQDVWQALEDHLGWENLEERWAGRGRIDPCVLAYLRDQAAGRDPLP